MNGRPDTYRALHRPGAMTAGRVAPSDACGWCRTERADDADGRCGWCGGPKLVRYRHAVDVDGTTLRTGPGYLTPREAGDAVAAYVAANAGPVAVTVRNVDTAAGAE